MLIATILETKGRDVVTLGADATLADVVAELVAHKIGAIVIVETGDQIVGIVSERDIVKALARGGTDVLSGTVASVMTRNVVTCKERDTTNDVMGRMTRERFRHLPVVQHGRLAGIISIGDVVKARIEEVEREAEEMRAYIATA